MRVKIQNPGWQKAGHTKTIWPKTIWPKTAWQNTALRPGLGLLAGMVLLAGCQHIPLATSQASQPVAAEAAAPMAGLAAVREIFDATAAEIPTLTAVGYAVVSTQPGRSEAQKRLMAIRAARMAAMRDLAEQIHGLKVDSSTTVIDLMVQNDTFRGQVSGTIRGARTVRINPTGSDTYEIVLEIDRELVSQLMLSARAIG